jgi:hypothetical protein
MTAGGLARPRIVGDPTWRDGPWFTAWLPSSGPRPSSRSEAAVPGALRASQPVCRDASGCLVTARESHRILSANSPGASKVADSVYRNHASCPKFRPNDHQHEFANSIESAGEPHPDRNRHVLDAVRRMSPAEGFELMVKAGLMTAAEAEAAASRPPPAGKARPKSRTPRPAPAKKPAKVREA